MSPPAITLPRPLAIRLLHAAQLAAPDRIEGVVLGQGAQPLRFVPGWPAEGEIWARLWSVPDAPAEPSAQQLADGHLHLVISLNTKGVLEMRAWRLVDGAAVEQPLKLPDP